MSSEITIDAIRLALGMYQAEARVSGLNIANAYRTGATRLQLDSRQARSALVDIAMARDASSQPLLGARLQDASAHADQVVDTGAAINIDDEVGRMSVAATQYQVLADALNRHFGLMRLALGSRGGA